MGLETVKEEILNTAKEQAAALIAEARKEANRLMKETEKKIEEMKEKNEQETKRIIEMVKGQEIASAELENKKMILGAKKQLIENVFIEAKRRIENLDDKKREALTRSLLEKAKKDIEVVFVYCNKKDVKFIKGLNVEATGIVGGLVAENKEKTIRVDYSFEAILETIKENQLQSVNKVLFV